MIMPNSNHTDYMAKTAADTEECLQYVKKIEDILKKEYSEKGFGFTEADSEFYRNINEHTEALAKLLEIKLSYIERLRTEYDEADSRLTEMAKSF
ncbi:MAG: hypothetical protein IKU08_10500 [Clostridia bacterium]|nr:hypothetical protein [Clostridia bacterium]